MSKPKSKYHKKIIEKKKKLSFYLDSKRDEGFLWEGLLYLKSLYIKIRLRIKNYHIMILEKYKAVYFCIPKVGTSSCKRMFMDVLGAREFPYLKGNIVKYNKYFKFCFVRNPYTRVVSCYINKFKDKNPMSKIFIHCTKGFRLNMSFEEFVRVISEVPDEKADGHFRSQHTFVMKNDKLLVDYIGKFENLKKDINFIKKKLGLPKKFKLPNLNRSDNYDYRDFYDEETKDLVSRRYKKDFEVFGYEK